MFLSVRCAANDLTDNMDQVGVLEKHLGNAVESCVSNRNFQSELEILIQEVHTKKVSRIIPLYAKELHKYLKDNNYPHAFIGNIRV